MCEPAAHDHRDPGAAGGEHRPERERDEVADAAGRMLVEHRARRRLRAPVEYLAAVAHGAREGRALRGASCRAAAPPSRRRRPGRRKGCRRRSRAQSARGRRRSSAPPSRLMRIDSCGSQVTARARQAARRRKAGARRRSRFERLPPSHGKCTFTRAVGGELADALAAAAAGRDRDGATLAIECPHGCLRDAEPRALRLHARGDGARLGAVAERISRVLDVGSRVCSARHGPDRGADVNAGIRRVGAFAGRTRDGGEILAIRAHCFEPAGDEASREHRRHEDPGVAQSGGGAHQHRAGAETRKSPADAKDRRAHEQAPCRSRRPVGTWNPPPQAGAGRLSTSRNAIAVTATAPPKTNSERRDRTRRRRRGIRARRVGSSCAEIARPAPNSAPDANAAARRGPHGAEAQHVAHHEDVVAMRRRHERHDRGERATREAAEPADAMPAGAAVAQPRAESDQESGCEEQRRRDRSGSAGAGRN